MQETDKDATLSELKRAINEGFSGTYPLIAEYTRYKESLFIQNHAVIYQDRAVIPKKLRRIVLDTLHAAHQGTSSMQLRAQAIAFWPGMTQDIALRRAECDDCNRNAPSQATLPSEPSNPPSLPFQQIVADFYDFGGFHYLVAADRLSGFSEAFLTPTGTSHAGARGLVACLRKWFEAFGVPEQISSDGGTEFTSEYTQAFFSKWGVEHRISSAYHPQSNGRAEVAVKTVKRLMHNNTNTASGSLDTDRFLRAMLQLRNTPDPDCGISPAEIVFGRPLRDNLSFVSYSKRSAYSQRWQDAWSMKEEALRARFVKTTERLNQHARDLPPLVPGSRCFLQNQTGNAKKKWHRTGIVIEVQPHDKYVIKVDGTGRITTRNRQFLRMYKPYSVNIPTMEPTLSNEFENKPLVRQTNTHPSLLTDEVQPSNVGTDAPPEEENIIIDHHRSCKAAPSCSNHRVEDAVSSSSPQMWADEAPSCVAQSPRPSRPSPPRARVPLALKRLQPFNNPGLRERRSVPREAHEL